MQKPRELCPDDVKPKTPSGKARIIKGAGGHVSATSIGRARSVAGSQPYGRPSRSNPIHPMQPLSDMGSGGPHG